MAEKCNLYELQKEIPYESVAPILTAWDEQSDNDVADLARMAYDAGRNSISKEKNKMAEVAKLFGKRLGEEFTVSVPRYNGYREIKDKVLVNGWFGSRGFQSEQIMIADSYIFAELLEGEAVIVDESNKA